MWRYAVQLLILPLPWEFRRRILNAVFGYRISPEATIGLSIVAPDELIMRPGARIGHLNVVRGMQRVEMHEMTIITNLNWIFALVADSPFLKHEPDRVSELILEEHSAIVSRHVVECSAPVVLKPFSTITGMRSMLLTHSVDMRNARLRSRPITIGRYGIVGSGCTIVDGAILPDRSILGPGSMLRTPETEELRLYSGVPATAVGAPLDPEMPVFLRTTGAMPGYYEA